MCLTLYFVTLSCRVFLMIWGNSAFSSLIFCSYNLSTDDFDSGAVVGVSHVNMLIVTSLDNDAICLNLTWPTSAAVTVRLRKSSHDDHLELIFHINYFFCATCWTKLNEGFLFSVIIFGQHMNELQPLASSEREWVLILHHRQEG